MLRLLDGKFTRINPKLQQQINKNFQATMKQPKLLSVIQIDVVLHHSATNPVIFIKSFYRNFILTCNTKKISNQLLDNNELLKLFLLPLQFWEKSIKLSLFQEIRKNRLTFKSSCLYNFTFFATVTTISNENSSSSNTLSRKKQEEPVTVRVAQNFTTIVLTNAVFFSN